MISFILYNTKKLFTITHFFLLIIYCSIAWFLSNPNHNLYSIYNSAKLAENYDLILYSIVMLNFILLINIHFINELKDNNFDNIFLRLNGSKLFWGLTICYVIYLFIGFIIPFYSTALIQQLYYAPSNITISVYIIKIISGVIGYSIFWIILSIYINLRYHNEVVLLLLFVFIYSVLNIIGIFTNDLLFSQFWWINSNNNTLIIDFSLDKLIIWLIIFSASIIGGIIISKNLNNLELSKSYTKGLFSKTAEIMNAFISMYHFYMLGLLTQTILFVFSFIGLVFVLLIVTNQNANLLVLGNLYVGVLLPIIFSFNQYYLIKIDRDAGMVHNIFLRDYSYWEIIFNRWFIMIIPQLLVSLFFMVILKLFVPQIQILFIIYILLINVFCSILNLFFSIFTQSGTTSNLLILFLVYFQLREDVQNIFISNPTLRFINIFDSLLNSDYMVSIQHLILLLSIILCLVYFSIISLKKIKYVNLENS